MAPYQKVTIPRRGTSMRANGSTSTVPPRHTQAAGAVNVHSGRNEGSQASRPARPAIQRPNPGNQESTRPADRTQHSADRSRDHAGNRRSMNARDLTQRAVDRNRDTAGNRRTVNARDGQGDTTDRQQVSTSK